MNEIKIYTADVRPLSDAERFRTLYHQVSAQRREKVDRMRFDKGKRLSLGAGALLRAALSAEGVSDFTMTSGQNGKPRLAHHADIHFNLSHSGTRVMCAVSDSAIGCDVEQIREMDMKIARRFFYAEEYETLMQCKDSEERSALFFRYWTLKESFMKATGLGFALALDAFCILLSEDGVSVRQSVDARRFFFREFDLHDGYRYAVCSAEKALDGAVFQELVL